MLYVIKVNYVLCIFRGDFGSSLSTGKHSKTVGIRDWNWWAIHHRFFTKKPTPNSEFSRFLLSMWLFDEKTTKLFMTSESPKYSNPPIFCCLQNFVFFLIKSRAKYWNHATFSNSDCMGVQFKALKYVIQNYLKKSQQNFLDNSTIRQFEFEYFGGSDVVNKLFTESCDPEIVFSFKVYMLWLKWTGG